MKYSLLFLITTFCAIDAQLPVIPSTQIPPALIYHIPTIAEMAQGKASSSGTQSLDTKHKKELEPAPVVQPISSELLAIMERNREQIAQEKRNEERCSRLLYEAIKRDVPHFPLNHYSWLFQKALYHLLTETDAFSNQSLDRIEITDSRYFDPNSAIQIITLACVPHVARYQEEVQKLATQQKEYTEKEVRKASWEKTIKDMKPLLESLIVPLDSDYASSNWQFGLYLDMIDEFVRLKDSQDPEVQQFLQMPVTINIKPLSPEELERKKIAMQPKKAKPKPAQGCLDCTIL